MQHPAAFIGVDVAKATLAWSTHGSPGRHDLGNDDVSISAWLQTLPKDAAIAVESTGKFHLNVVRLAHLSGRSAYVLNARDVFFFAKALGVRAKTDRTDAGVIASYLAQNHAELKPWRPPTPAQDRVQGLLRCRAAVSAKRSSVRQALKEVDGLDRVVGELEEKFDSLLQEMDRQVSALLQQDERLAGKRAQLSTITGVGPQASALFVSLFSRIQFGNVNALIAYTGLDPRPNDSGNKVGRRRLTKRGNADLRRQLYLCAFAASHSKAFGPLYRSIKAKGFKPTEALIILGRKILRIMWAVWNSGKPFDLSLAVPLQACART